MAKYWIVSSSLFVPGRLMAPIRIQREVAAMRERKSKLENELAALPTKIADAERQLGELGEEYKPFEHMERN
jgi:predicted  nucleic acid-binding Zn-ribbon protein